MLILTPDEKIAAYTYCIEMVKAKVHQFVCPNLLNWISFNLKGRGDHQLFLNIFPEFMAKRPKQRVFYEGWWPETYEGGLERIKALQECIEECKNQST